MCLACLDPVIDALKSINPFKRKRKVKQSEEDDDFDRDNIELPYLVEEKRSVMTSDPGVSALNTDDSDHLSVSSKKVLTMKKVSSLALV